MMNWIVSTSLRLRVLVLALSIVLMIVGIQTARNAPLDVFPEFAPPLDRDPDRGAGAVDRGGREPDQRAAGERAERHDRAQDDPVEVGAGAVVGGADPQGGHRPDVGAAGGAGAAGGRGVAAAGGGAPAGDPLAAVVDQPADEDRRLVEDALADGPDAAGEVDDPAAADGDSRAWPTSRSGASATGSTRCWSTPTGCGSTA